MLVSENWLKTRFTDRAQALLCVRFMSGLEDTSFYRRSRSLMYSRSTGAHHGGAQPTPKAAPVKAYRAAKKIRGKACWATIRQVRVIYEAELPELEPRFIIPHTSASQVQWLSIKSGMATQGLLSSWARSSIKEWGFSGSSPKQMRGTCCTCRLRYYVSSASSQLKHIWTKTGRTRCVRSSLEMCSR
jgi:hypothetical protein